MGVEVDGKLLAEQSLPLMRKTFIEAENPHGLHRPEPTSLPLMRKTFIEAGETLDAGAEGSRVSSAYAEDFH